MSAFLIQLLLAGKLRRKSTSKKEALKQSTARVVQLEKGADPTVRQSWPSLLAVPLELV
jgi:hypothetical protein